jgi:exosortase/archaeosortase
MREWEKVKPLRGIFVCVGYGEGVHGWNVIAVAHNAKTQQNKTAALLVK